MIKINLKTYLTPNILLNRTFGFKNQFFPAQPETGILEKHRNREFFVFLRFPA